MTAAGFSPAEYERRWSDVLSRIEREGLDAITVTARQNLEYLTGHDAGGAYAAPYFLVIAPGREHVFIVRRYDERSVADDLAVPHELRTYFGRGDAIDVWAKTLRSLKLERARLGLELDLWGLAPMDVRRLEAMLPELRVRDASRLVTSAAEVKSSEEIAAMRRAAEATDLAAEAFYAALNEGVTELEAGAAVERAIAEAGAEDRGFALLFGERTALPHGRRTANRLGRGDVAFIEVGAHHLSYAAGLCRTAVLGRHPEAEALHAVAEDATAAGVEALRPGVLASEVHQAVHDVVAAAGRERTFRQRTGYSIGIDWYQRGYASLEPSSARVIEPGMAFHLPRILFDESGRFGVGTSETVVVGANGPEVLSRLPNGLRLI
jgi:Xaa-Pro dipeptidase